MQNVRREGESGLSFREKLELCRLLDRLGVDVIETGELRERRSDGLLLKSLAGLVQNACLCVPVPTDAEDGADFVSACLREAKRARLQVALPTSAVQMEYLCHLKPDALLGRIERCVAACKRVCPDVEFCAGDAGRSDPDFLRTAIERAVAAGANTVTVCDAAGTMLPEEFCGWVRGIKAALPEGVRLGVRISDTLYQADACAAAAIRGGADEVKAALCGDGTVSLKRLATILGGCGDRLDARCAIRMTELGRTAAQAERICKAERSGSSPFDSGVRDAAEDFTLGSGESRAAVQAAAEKLGYTLSEDDLTQVYEAYQSVTAKKPGVSAKELDALIASAALQVPQSYTLDSYVINAGNLMGATSHIKLRFHGQAQEGLAVGDGPIDAAFLAIEQITGTHYELDDFQIRAVTEGREAMGEAVVRLRSGGKLYAGRGISTDIVGSSIYAYLGALNKIVYEENAQ